MSLFDAIVLGLVQGLTEFLPVSSSGHLVIAGTILGVPTPGIFVEVALHVATLLAVLIVYRQRVANLVVGALRREAGAWRYIGLLILASVPAGIVGVFADAVERASTRGSCLITGVITVVLTARGSGGRRPGTAGDRGLRAHGGRRRSRSCRGSRAPAHDRDRALGAPVGRGRGRVLVPDVRHRHPARRCSRPAKPPAVHDVGAVPLAVGFIVALVSGVLAIRFLLWLLRRQTFFAFAYYV